MNYKKVIYLACFMSILLLVGNVPAATRTWDAGGDGESWDDGDNWSDNTKPGVGDYAQLGAGGEALVDSTMTESCNRVYVALSGASGTLNITGGSLSTTGATDYIFIGYTSTATGTVNMSGGTLSGGDQIFCGMYGPGVFNMTGGSVSSADKTVIGRTANVTGTWNMSGGTLTTTSHLYVGESGTGTLNLVGGTITATTDLYIGVHSGSSGTINLDGGTINARDLYMYSGRSTMDVTGGTLVLDGDDESTVQGYIDNGYITAYGGDPAATLNLDYNVTTAGKTTLTATGTSSPYGYIYNGPHNMPGTLQAEDFNGGRSRYAYYSETSGNQGNNTTYRTGVDVDIYTDASVVYVQCSDQSSVSEFLNYTFAISSAGWYDVVYRARGTGGEGNNSQVVTLIDDRALGWSPKFDPNVFTDCKAVKYVYLTATTHVLKIGCKKPKARIDYIDISSVSAPSGLSRFLVDTGEDMIVSDVNILASPFSADNTGVNDCTTAIQDALDLMGDIGGGTVYLPAGQYKVDATLTVPRNTTLAGDWKKPADLTDINDITLLKATYGGLEYGDPNFNPNNFINLRYSSCVRDISIWYPHQVASDPCQYPYTIASLDKWSHDCAIQNITLYNSYKGIEICVSGTKVANIYGTVIQKGFLTRLCLGISHLHNVNFGNSYWEDADANVITNAPTSANDIAAFNLYTTANLDGVTIGQNDNYQVYGITVADAHRGIVIEQQDGDQSEPYGILTKISAEIFEVNDIYRLPNLRYINTDLVPETSSMSYTFGTYSKPGKTGPNSLYIVTTDYNAVGDGITDDTSAIQAALTAAGNEGGGTVYLPPGQYKISTHLSVPQGVELRGSSGHRQISWTKETCVLLAYEGKDTGSPDSATAFITLNQDSGIRGLKIFYPEQGYGSVLRPVHTYPYTIRGNGSGVWAIDLHFINTYNMIDLATNRCDDHFVSDIWATNLNTGIKVGGGSEDGKIERINFNYAQYSSSLTQNSPCYDDADVIEEYCLDNMTGYVFGNCSGQKSFGMTDYHANVHLIVENANCNNAEFWHSLSDNSKDIGFYFDEGGTISMIGAAGGNVNGNWLVTESTFSGTVNIYDKMLWGSGYTLHVDDGGKINFYNDETLTAGKTVTAISYAGASDPNKAVDRLENTKWTCTDAGTKWLKVDLGQPCEINRWHLKNDGVNPLSHPIYNTADADLEYSMDDSTYTVADGFTNSTYNFLDRAFDSARARYVKLKVISGTQPGYDGYARIAEFMVYGKEGWHFTTDDDQEGWTLTYNISSIDADDGKLEITSSSNDPAVLSSDSLGIDTSLYNKVKVRMMNKTTSTTGQIFFITNADTTWNQAKSDVITTLTTNDSLYREYTFDFSDCNDWTGTLKRLRFDPVATTGDVSIDYIKLE